jgi:hypothetical protein
MDWFTFSFVDQRNSGAVLCGWLLTPDSVNRDMDDPTWIRCLTKLQATYVVPNNGIGVAGDPFNPARSALSFGLIAWPGIPSPNVSPDAASQVGFAALPTLCPNPLLDGNLDWIHRIIFPVAPALGTGISLSTQLAFNGGNELDQESSAMRRLGNNIGVLWVFANDMANIASFSFNTRYLLKL